jgi:hypothetical protein
MNMIIQYIIKINTATLFRTKIRPTDLMSDIALFQLYVLEYILLTFW